MKRLGGRGRGRSVARGEGYVDLVYPAVIPMYDKLVEVFGQYTEFDESVSQWQAAEEASMQAARWARDLENVPLYWARNGFPRSPAMQHQVSGVWYL
ncbi:MAG: hypothetical protein ACE5FA_06060, partial [Dehalococcoidia bacterium]